MKVLSCFDGIACARVALDKSGIAVEKYYASEIEADAMRVAQKQWKDITEVGSIIGLLNSGWIDESIDLLIGGSPCQDLSIAKKGRQGLQGTRSKLFYEFVEIKNTLKPKWFILENVNSMPKDARDEMSRLMGVEPIMIDAALVSAQSRRRLFWTNIPNVILPEDRKIFLKDVIENADTDRLKSYAIDASYYKGASEQNYMERGHRQLVYFKAPNGKEVEIDPTKDIYTFQEARTEKGKVARREFRQQTGKDMTKRGKDDKMYIPQDSGKANCITTGLGVEGMIYVREATKKGYAVAREGDSVDLSFPSSTTRRGRVGQKVKNIMTSQNIGVVQNGMVRMLTPVECERLQGLPDEYTAGISNSQRYACLGNAFNADVIAHILSFIPKT